MKWYRYRNKVYNKFYYIDTSVLLENRPLVKFIPNHIRNNDAFADIKLYLNSLVYDRNIFESSSKFFSNLRKFLENVRQHAYDLRTNFGKFSEIFVKWSEISGKSSITPTLVYLHNKKNITC